MADDREVDYRGLARYALSEAQMAQEARDVAARRQRQSVKPEGGRQEGAATEFARQMVIPQTPLDLALMTLGGPLPKAAKVGALTLGGLLTADEAQAGPSGAIRKAAGSAAEAGRGALKFWQTSPDIRIQPGETRVSTRFPTAVNRVADPLQYHLSVGRPEMLDPATIGYNTQQLANSPGFARLKTMAPEEAAQAYVDQATKNLMALYERSPQAIQQRAPRWYEGAHEFAGALADRYGIPRQSASAATAVLSPQKDWFQNASLAERVGDVVFGAPKPWSSEMMAAARARPALIGSPVHAQTLRQIEGKPFEQLGTDAERALWTRLYDEAHNPRPYRAINPEGTFGDFITTGTGEPAAVAWGTMGDIDKAIRAYRSGGDVNVISPLLGEKHKVRSFYNNIEVPFERRFGDVTGDTHQIAAGQLRPLAGGDPEVLHGLESGFKLSDHPGWGGPLSSAITGVKGTYPFSTEPVRMAARETGTLPREMQSATWEAIRGLFPATFKTAKNKQAVDDIWRAYDRGELSHEQAVNTIFDLAGGIKTPGWARSGARADDPRRSSTYR